MSAHVHTLPNVNVGNEVGRPRGTVGRKASASKARGPGFEPPWLVQRSRCESRLRVLTLVGNGAGAVTHLIDRAGSVFPRGTGRFLVKKDVHIASFRCLSDETLSLRPRATQARGPSEGHWQGGRRRSHVMQNMRA